MKEVRLITWQDFEDEISSVLQKTRERRVESGTYVSDVLFRGQGNAHWGLDTTLERYSAQRYKMVDYYNIMRAVEPTVESFTGKSWDLSNWHFKNEHADPPRPPQGYEFMVYLRHHGFPSPLLDWTRSPYVAAFFAFRSKEQSTDASAAIYCYIEYYGEGKIGYPGKARIAGLGPYVTTHKRHYNQQSEYTICYKPIDGACVYCKHEEAFRRGESEQDIMTKYVIPRSEREKVLERLEIMNVSSYSLFGHEESLMETLAYREIERRSDL